MKKLTLATFFYILIIACQTAKNSKQEENNKLQRINELFGKAEKLTLPLVWENTSNEYPVAKNKLISPDKFDTDLFEGEANTLTLIGVLEDTSRFYTFLFSYPADDTRPYILTIDKQGELINQFLSGYSCGADCGYYCVGATFSLEKDFSFKSKHISYRAECINNYSTIDTSKVTSTVVEKRGVISKKGVITEKKEEVIEEREIPFSSEENPIEYFE